MNLVLTFKKSEISKQIGNTKGKIDKKRKAQS